MMNKNEFNKMAEDDPAGSQDGGRSARMKRASARIINYADIDKEYGDDTAGAQALRDKMEKYMAPIDRDPTSFEAIIAYGTEPIDALGKVAVKMLDVQSKLGETVKVMNIAMGDMDKAFSMAGVEKLGTALKKLAIGAGTGAVKVGKGIGNLTKKFYDALTGAKKKRTEEEAQVQMMIDNLPNMYDEMKKMSKALKDAESGIKDVMKVAETLGKARIESVRELNIYLGAAPEVLRRYEEIYIKEATEAFKASGDAEDDLYLQKVIKGRDNFRGQFNILESSRTQGIQAGQQLKMLIDELENQRKIIQQFSTIRENEWLALLNSAGIAGSSLKIAQLTKKSDEVGDRLLEATTDMQEKAHEMALNSQARGTVDPAKLLESLTRMQKMIEDENAIKEKRYLEGEATRQQIRAETERMLDTIEKAKAGRLLEAAPEKTPAAPITPVADNDNAQPAEANIPPRRTGTGPAPKP